MISTLKSLNSMDTTPVDNASFAQDTRVLEYNRSFMADKIEIQYNDEMDGGGTTFGQRYRHVLAELYPNKTFENCYEWCSGPGFIGFDLLSRNFCEKLYLSDIFKPAIRTIARTVRINKEHCENRVFFSHSQTISDLPQDWKFDLVVSNPPHWNQNSGQMITKIHYNYRVTSDLDWRIHQEFFDNIKNHLNPGAVILLQEHSYGSGPDLFKTMIENNGMSINDCYWESNNPDFYYLEIKLPK